MWLRANAQHQVTARQLSSSRLNRDSPDGPFSDVPPTALLSRTAFADFSQEL